MLNPVRVTPTDTCDMIDFQKEEVFTLTEAAAAMQGLKSRKAAGEDEIQLEILKTLNGEGVRWLTRVCQAVWKLKTIPKNWHTSVIIPIYKKSNQKEYINY